MSKKEHKGIELAPEIKKAIKNLDEPEQQFVLSYVQHLNKTQAAKDAGYSVHTAGTIGYQVYHRPDVRLAIKEILALRVIDAEENIKSIQAISESNLADYFRPVTRYRTDKKPVPLGQIIAEIELKIELEDDFMLVAKLDKIEEKIILKQIKVWEREILKYKVELRKNPDAFRRLYVEEEVTEMELDLAAVIADKEKGIIKSVKYTKEGIQIETYNALDAKDKLARIHGSFEKDNRDRAPIVDLGNAKIIFK